jgi:hypothetical protein
MIDLKHDLPTIVPLGEGALVFNTLPIDVRVADSLRKAIFKAVAIALGPDRPHCSRINKWAVASGQRAPDLSCRTAHSNGKLRIAACRRFTLSGLSGVRRAGARACVMQVVAGSNDWSLLIHTTIGALEGLPRVRNS